VAYDLGRSEGLIRITYDSEGVAHAEADLTNLDETVKKLGQAAARINIDILDEDAKRELESLQRRIELLAVNMANPEINVSDEQAKRAIEQISLQLHALDAQSTQVDFEVNTEQVVREIGRIEAEIETLQGMSGDVEVDVDASDAEHTIKELAAKLRDLEKIRTDLEINVDDKEAEKELRTLQDQLLELDKSTTHIGIELDKARAENEVKEFEKRLKKLQKEVVTVKLNPDTERAKEDLREVAIRLDLIARKHADAKINIDGTAEAMAELAAVSAELDRLDGREADPRVGKAAMSQYAQFRESLFSILQLAAAFSPALIPVAGALSAVAVAGASAFATLGAGLGLFAGAAIADLKGVAGGLKLIKQSQDAYNKALATGDQAAQLKAIHESIGAMNQLEPSERLVAMGVLKLKDAWSNMAASIKPDVLEAAYRVMGGLVTIVDQLAPLMSVIGTVAVDTAKKFQQFAASKEVKRFLDDLASSFTQIGEDAGDTFFNILTSILNVLHVLTPFGIRFADTIANLSDRLKNFTGSGDFAKGVQDFFAYAQKVAPDVEKFVKALGEALVAVGAAAAPLGPVMLRLLTMILQVITAVASSPFGPYIIGLASMALAAKSLFGPISSAITNIHEMSLAVSALKGDEKAFEALSTGSQRLVASLKAARDGAVTAAGAIKDAGKATADWVKNMAAMARANAGAAFTKMKDAAAGLATSIGSVAKSMGKSLISGLVSLSTTLYAAAAASWAFIAPWLPWIALAAAIGAAIYLLYRNWDTVWNGIKTIFTTVVDFVIAHWKLLLLALPVIGPLLALIASNWNTIWNGMQAVFGAVVGAIIASAQFLWSTLTSIFTTSLGIISAVWNAVWSAVKAVADFIWGAIRVGITREINGIMAVIQFVTGVIQAVWSGALNAMRAVASSVWGAITGIVSGAIGAVLGAVRGVFAIAGIFASAFNSAITAVQQGISGILSRMYGIAGAVLGAIGDLGGLLYNAGVSIIAGLLRGIVDKAEDVYHFVSGIAGKIAGLKGPIEYDRKLLIPHGESIVAGLREGIESSLPGLYDMVSSIAPVVQMTAASSISPAIPSAAGGGGGGGISINFDFSGSTFGSDGAELIKSAVTDSSVLDKINTAARQGVRP
jgi:hypothetical protein